MDDRLKQSISALIDDEANELELQRILAHHDQEEVQETWGRYHGIRDAVNAGQQTHMQIDISQAVAQAIALDEEVVFVDDNANKEQVNMGLTGAHKESSSENRRNDDQKRHYSRTGGLLALAASIAFGFFMFFQGSEISGKFNDLGSLTVADRSPLVNGTATQPLVMVEMSEDHVMRFNQYLLRHAEHSVRGSQSGFMPLARVASVNSVGI